MASIGIDPRKNGELSLSLTLSPKEVARVASVVATVLAATLTSKAEIPPGRPWVAPPDATE